MIIDSHAHYSVFQYQNEFPFLDGKDGVLFRNHGTKKELFAHEKCNEKSCNLPQGVR